MIHWYRILEHNMRQEKPHPKAFTNNNEALKKKLGLAE
jgi:hypothetical protein